jgi:PBSX family phage terminase large subunit
MNFTPNSVYQQMVMDTSARFILCIAGAQGGKTTIGAVWLISEIYKSYASRQAKGDTSLRQWLICAPTVKILHQSTMVKFQEYFPSDWGEWKEQKQCFELVWGDKIFVRSADDPNHLEGMTLAGAWLDEFGQMVPQVWINLQARLIHHKGRCVMTTTPYLGHFWVKKSVYDRAGSVNGVPVVRDSVDDQITVVEWKTADNPAIDKEEITRQRKLLPPEVFELRYEAKFTQPQGLVYRDFSEEEDVIPPFVLNGEWERFGGLDFGFGSITCLLGVAKKPEVRNAEGVVTEPAMFYVFREFYKKGAMLADVAHAINSMGLKYVLYDPRGAQEAAELTRAYGIKNIRPADNDVEVGIERLRVLFREKRLKIFGNCVNAIEELLTYHYNDEKEGRDSDGRPVKKHDHAMDALKYSFSRQVEGLYKERPNSLKYQLRQRIGSPTRQAHLRNINPLTGY